MRESFVSVAGTQLFVRDVGRGTPIVVLHGGPDFNHNYLVPELDRLASAFRVIYYDQRGRGKSAEGVVPEAIGIESEVADVDAVRRHFGFDAIALLGHSWGCVLALEYATRHPDRVSHLLLLNAAPTSHADLATFRERRVAAEAPRLAKMRKIAATTAFAAGDIAAEADYCRLHYGATLPDKALLDVLVRRLRAHFTPAGTLKARAIENRLHAQTWLAPDYDLPARLRNVDIPTLVVHGDRDLVPLPCARRIAAAACRSRLVVLADCGHFAYLERWNEVEAAITGFLLSGTRPPLASAG